MQKGFKISGFQISDIQVNISMQKPEKFKLKLNLFMNIFYMHEREFFDMSEKSKHFSWNDGKLDS